MKQTFATQRRAAAGKAPTRQYQAPVHDEGLGNIDDAPKPRLDRLRTLQQIARENPAFPISRLRAFFFYSKVRHSSKGVVPANGYARAFLKVGRRVYCDLSILSDCILNSSSQSRN